MSKTITVSDATGTLLTQLRAGAKEAEGKSVTYGQVVDCIIDLAKKEARR